MFLIFDSCLLMCCRCVYFVFFFFKQKTAYEMRISDWSSDVCSSDLSSPRNAWTGGSCRRTWRRWPCSWRPTMRACAPGMIISSTRAGADAMAPVPESVLRSEEHTSELQSLMRISYAVFCLKKKNNERRLTKKHENVRQQNGIQYNDSIETERQ